jgi:hypothetical protein
LNFVNSHCNITGFSQFENTKILLQLIGQKHWDSQILTNYEDKGNGNFPACLRSVACTKKAMALSKPFDAFPQAENYSGKESISIPSSERPSKLNPNVIPNKSTLLYRYFYTLTITNF